MKECAPDRDYLEYDAEYREERHPDDGDWSHDRPRFLCRVDSETLAKLANGKACLEDETCRPWLQSITEKILHMIDHFELRPPRDWHGPAQWRPRRFNTRADSMCNIILDGHENFELQGDNVDVVLGLKPQFLIQTYGGCRNEGTTAL